MTDQAPELLREQVARIIAPNIWELIDEHCAKHGYIGEQKREVTHGNLAVVQSFLRADAVIALLTSPPSERPVAQVREALATPELNVDMLPDGRCIPEISDEALWTLSSTLHSNVPEEQRPMSWSDFSPEQIERLRLAAKAFLAALTAERPSEAVEAAVAWRWRPKGEFSSRWIYDPEPQWLEEHKHEIEAQPLYAIPHEEPGRETMTSVAGEPKGSKSR